MGVPKDQVYADYLRSNDYILPAYKPSIDKFVGAGGDPSIPNDLLGVQAAYLDASFDEMRLRYGAIGRYFEEGLGIGQDGQQSLRARFLGT